MLTHNQIRKESLGTRIKIKKIKIAKMAADFRSAILKAKLNNEFELRARMMNFPNGCYYDSCNFLVYYLYEKYQIHSKQGNGVYLDNDPNNTTNHV